MKALVLGRVAHPNVVSVIGAGTCPVHGRYVAMEHLEGRSIQGLLATRGALRCDQVVRVLREVGTALAAVHRANVVRRDVKPANLGG